MSLATTDLEAAAARTPRVFAMLLRLLASNWTYGRLTVHLPNGEAHVLEGEQPGASGVMHVKDYGFARRVLAAGDIGFAEGYMAGEWDSPHLAALLETLVDNYDHIRRLFDGNWLMMAVNWLAHRGNRNSRNAFSRSIAAADQPFGRLERLGLSPSPSWT